MGSFKRSWCLWGAALFLVMAPLLQGCSSDMAGGSSKRITIRELDYFTGDPANSVMNALIKKFEKTHPDIKIQRHSVDRGTLAMKIIQQGSTHNLPGILIVDNPSLKQIAGAGILTPLNQLGHIDQSKYYSSSLSTVTYKNKLYGLPLGNNTLALFYNKKILKNEKVQPPKTWKSLVSAAKKLTQGSTYGIAFAAPSTEEGTWQFLPFLWSNGGTLKNISSPKSIEALNLWKKLVSKGYASDSVVNWTQANVEQEFVHNNAAMMVNGLWELPIINQVSNFKYGVVPIPVPHSGMKPKVPLGGEVVTIPKTTPAKEKAAWRFMKWMQDPKRLSKMDAKLHYIPAYKPATQKILKDNPSWKPFYKEFLNGRARTQYLGANYPAASQTIWTALQETLTGKQTPKQALNEAQKKIKRLIKK